MRALTPNSHHQGCRRTSRNNEVLAREGIDTLVISSDTTEVNLCNNEVLAREGIDTVQRVETWFE